VSKIIHELKNKRQKYLLTLYEKTEGNKFSIVNMWDVGGELGFTKEETRNIVGYLESERMLQHESLGGGISITHEGILRAEESLEVLGNDYWVNDPDSNRREASISIFAKLRDEIATYIVNPNVKTTK
jgi:hypothetical protein